MPPLCQEICHPLCFSPCHFNLISHMTCCGGAEIALKSIFCPGNANDCLLLFLYSNFSSICMQPRLGRVTEQSVRLTCSIISVQAHHRFLYDSLIDSNGPYLGFTCPPACACCWHRGAADVRANLESREMCCKALWANVPFLELEWPSFFLHLFIFLSML